MSPFAKQIVEEIEKLLGAKAILEQSYNRCEKLLNKLNLSIDEAEMLEAFNSRFCRLTDLYLQSSLKLIDIVDAENEGSLRDRLNRAEKKGLIESSKNYLEMRYLRNKMSHDYILLSLPVLFTEAFLYTKPLFRGVDNAIAYLQKINEQ